MFGEEWNYVGQNVQCFGRILVVKQWRFPVFFRKRHVSSPHGGRHPSAYLYCASLSSAVVVELLSIIMLENPEI